MAADAGRVRTHRAYHEIPFLWRFHAVHYSPQQMDWLSGSRVHVFEILATRATILVPIFLLGFPQDTIFSYIIFVSIQAVLIHSNIATDLGWLRYLVVTPQFHHWHHASDAEALDRNYAAHTPILDLLFGTYHPQELRHGETNPRQFPSTAPLPVLRDRRAAGAAPAAPLRASRRLRGSLPLRQRSPIRARCRNACSP